MHLKLVSKLMCKCHKSNKGYSTVSCVVDVYCQSRRQCVDYARRMIAVAVTQPFDRHFLNGCYS